MKKFIFSFCFILFAVASWAQSQVYETRTIKSSVLNADRRYAVYLPDGYDKTDQSYPVLYLLHGYGDNHTGWVQFGMVQHIADKSIAGGDCSKMIIVMPDASTPQPGYFNTPDGKYNYEKFFFEEFIPHIEKTYRVRSERRYRAIAGLSMGGGGTTYFALHRPDMFGAACPLSAYLGAENLEQFKSSVGKSALIPNTENISQSVVMEYFTRHNIAAYLESLSDEELNKIRQVRWYLSCGDDDFLIEANNAMSNTMRKFKVPMEYRVKDGAHNWSYWRMELPLVLEFISKSFNQY